MKAKSEKRSKTSINVTPLSERAKTICDDYGSVMSLLYTDPSGEMVICCSQTTINKWWFVLGEDIVINDHVE